MAAGQNDGARVRVAGAQIVKEFLAEIGNGVDVENEEIGLRSEDDVVGLSQSRRDVHFGGRRGFVERGANFLGEVQVRLEHENASAWRGLVSGMACFVWR